MPRKRRTDTRIDLSRVRTYPLSRRRSIVDRSSFAKPPRPGMRVAELVDSLPDILAGRNLKAIAHEIATRHRAGRLLVLGMGAHPIKVGLSPLVIDFMRRGIISAVAMNGAGIIHDFELAYRGETSEDVGPGLETGRFGMAHETGEFLNQAISKHRDEGIGAAVGRAILDGKLRHRQLSILAAGERLDVPVTVHVGIGADIVHMHPSADGAAIGFASLADFHRLAGIAQNLDRGTYINLGSAVMLPEVFLKALNLARNVGSKVGALLTVDMDFIRQYRTLVNVVQRPTDPDGQGYQLVGHHEIMFPLLCAAVLDRLETGRPKRSDKKRS